LSVQLRKMAKKKLFSNVRDGRMLDRVHGLATRGSITISLIS